MEILLVMTMRIVEEDWSESIQKEEIQLFFRCDLNQVGEHNGRMILGGTPSFPRATTMITSALVDALNIAMLSEECGGWKSREDAERWCVG